MLMPQRKLLITLFLLFTLTFSLVTCTGSQTQVSPTTQATSQKTEQTTEEKPILNIWWSQGFLPEENQAITDLVSAWEKETGMKANLRLEAENNLLSSTRTAIEKNKTPDVLLIYSADADLFPILAWQNQLADVSDIIEPIKDNFTPSALESVNYQNSVQDKKRSYYAVPIAQQAPHIFYWRNLLAEAGFTDPKLPKNWEEFWQIWPKAQQQLRQKGNNNIYGMGLTISPLGADTSLAFEQFLEAYNVKIVAEYGKLIIDNPGNREGIIAALKQYADTYKSGYIPPNVVEWKDSGNNVSFLEGESLMTINSTLSIPLTQKQENNPYNKNSRDLYYQKIAMTEWPNKPNGQPLTSILGIKQAVIFENSKNKEAAKSFLSFLLKQENLDNFLQALKGRLFPVISKVLQEPYWKDPSDPHLSGANNQFFKETRPPYQVFNPAYSEVTAQQIWAKAIISIIKDGVTPEDAADKAIDQISQIFANWK